MSQTPVPLEVPSAPAEMVTAYVAPNQRQVVTSNITGQVTNGTTMGTDQPVQAMATPTQVRRPWRSMVRTIFQVGLALATLIPLVSAEVYQTADAAPAAVAQVLTIAGIVTRVMAMAPVEKFLQDWAPWLATSPPALTRAQRKALNA